MKLTEAAEILEVDVNADEGEVKKAFKKLMLRVHPDKNVGNEEWSKTETQKGTSAMGVFKAFWESEDSDAENFDEDDDGMDMDDFWSGMRGGGGGGMAGGMGDFGVDDFLEMMFAARFAPGGRGGGTGGMPGMPPGVFMFGGGGMGGGMGRGSPFGHHGHDDDDSGSYEDESDYEDDESDNDSMPSLTSDPIAGLEADIEELQELIEDCDDPEERKKMEQELRSLQEERDDLVAQAKEDEEAQWQFRGRGGYGGDGGGGGYGGQQTPFNPFTALEDSPDKPKYTPDVNSAGYKKKLQEVKEQLAWDEAIGACSDEYLDQMLKEGKERTSRIGGKVYEEERNLKKLKHMCKTRNIGVEFRIVNKVVGEEPDIEVFWRALAAKDEEQFAAKRAKKAEKEKARQMKLEKEIQKKAKEKAKKKKNKKAADNSEKKKKMVIEENSGSDSDNEMVAEALRKQAAATLAEQEEKEEQGPNIFVVRSFEKLGYEKLSILYALKGAKNDADVALKILVEEITKDFRNQGFADDVIADALSKAGNDVGQTQKILDEGEEFEDCSEIFIDQSAIDQDAVSEFLAMGFAPEHIQQALLDHKNDKDNALNQLLCAASEVSHFSPPVSPQKPVHPSQEDAGPVFDWICPACTVITRSSRRKPNRNCFVKRCKAPWPGEHSYVKNSQPPAPPAQTAHVPPRAVTPTTSIAPGFARIPSEGASMESPDEIATKLKQLQLEMEREKQAAEEHRRQQVEEFNAMLQKKEEDRQAQLLSQQQTLQKQYDSVTALEKYEAEKAYAQQNIELEKAKRMEAIVEAKEREAAARANRANCMHFMNGFCANGHCCQLKHDKVAAEQYQREQQAVAERQWLARAHEVERQKEAAVVEQRMQQNYDMEASKEEEFKKQQERRKMVMAATAKPLVYCKDLATKGGCTYPNCKFSHDKAAFGSQQGRVGGQLKAGKVRVCSEWARNGRCKFGDKCRYVSTHETKVTQDARLTQMQQLGAGGKQQNGRQQNGKQAHLFFCNKDTYLECAAKMMFGAPTGTNYAGVQVGSPLFLLNISTKEITGPFQATTTCQRDIDPDAWNGKFPFQVKVQKLTPRLELVTKEFVEKSIGMLPRSGKFTLQQTEKLQVLFSSKED
jgi:hypothetical protein